MRCSIAWRRSPAASAIDERITDIVNIGIGGSDLGPAMAARALASFGHPRLTCHFVSNVDSADIAANARRSRPRVDVVRRLVQDVHDHRDAHQRPHRPAVARRRPRRGGRRRPLRRRLHERRAGRRVRHRHRQHVRLLGLGRWSVLGGLGDRAVVDAARSDPTRSASSSPGSAPIDEHFRDSPLAANAPVLLGMIGVWHSNVLGYETKAVLPYSEELGRFPAYLQQLDMESNGKSVRLDGSPVTTSTPVRSCGASRARTASTRSTSCCTRAPGSCRSTSSGSPTRTTPIATTTTC